MTNPQYLSMNPELIQQVKLYVHCKHRRRDHQRQRKVKHLVKHIKCYHFIIGH